MSAAKAFFDTNVVLYLFSSDTAKADRAEEVLAQSGTISVQVLNELANVARRKLRLSWAEVIDILTHIRAVCEVEPLTVEIHVRGISLAQRYNLSVYDALILAAALQSGCGILYTEDLQDGQVIEEGLTIRNPFTTQT